MKNINFKSVDILENLKILATDFGFIDCKILDLQSLYFDENFQKNAEISKKNFENLVEKNQLTNNFLNVFLNGNLGAGKTFFMQNFIHSLGFKGNVKSPTYSVLETYSINNLNINHFDYYRIQNLQDF